MINQILSVLVGGAAGSLLRFFVSTGMTLWLGRAFPYGTLAVNLIGSFLVGLMTEALILQKVSIAMEFRPAILIGLFGGFTTFSTFSLETFYLFEQGHHLKAALNIVVSVGVGLFAVWLGLSSGRFLFASSSGVWHLGASVVPYGILVVNALGSCLIGFLFQILTDRTGLNFEHRAAVLVVVIGLFMTFSSLYLILYQIEHTTIVTSQLASVLAMFAGNVGVCLLLFWTGSILGRQF